MTKMTKPVANPELSGIRGFFLSSFVIRHWCFVILLKHPAPLELSNTLQPLLANRRHLHFSRGAYMACFWPNALARLH